MQHLQACRRSAKTFRCSATLAVDSAVDSAVGARGGGWTVQFGVISRLWPKMKMGRRCPTKLKRLGQRWQNWEDENGRAPKTDPKSESPLQRCPDPVSCGADIPSSGTTGHKAHTHFPPLTGSTHPPTIIKCCVQYSTHTVPSTMLTISKRTHFQKAPGLLGPPTPTHSTSAIGDCCVHFSMWSRTTSSFVACGSNTERRP